MNYLDEQFRLKVGLAEMLKGGVIMDVVNAEQAVIAEKAGASAVMSLDRVPSDIRKEGGVARMSPISKIREIMAAVSIPVMAKCRIGHFMEARILEALGVDYIDESEVLTPADEEHHVDKHDYKVPFVCGARNLGEALRRIAEGAAMIRTKGEAGSGNVVEAVRHIRTIVKEMKQLTVLGKDELVAESKKHQAPLELIEYCAEHGKLPVPNFLRRRNHAYSTPMPRWSCNWALRPSSWVPVSSSRPTPNCAPAPSSKPQPISTTRTSCWKLVKSWVSACRDSKSPKSLRAS